MRTSGKLFFVLSTLWIFWLGRQLELTDQEAYYWTWSVRPALCYFEHPPLQAWITHVLTSLWGDAAWVVRFPALIGRLASYFLFEAWVRRRLGEAPSSTALDLLNGSFFFVAGSLLCLPDSVMLPFALGTILWAERRAIWLTGLCLGMAGLAKWTSALLVPGVVACFLRRDSEGRRDWRGLSFVLLIAALLQTPVLVWNAQNDWASFMFHLKDRHTRELTPHWKDYIVNTLTFLGSQILVGGLSFGLGLSFALRGLFKRNWLRTPPGLWPSLAWWILPAFFVFGLSASRGELRFYWTVAAFPPLALGLAATLAKLSPSALSKLAKLQKICLFATLALVTFILTFPVGAYVKPFTDLYKHYDLRHSPRGDLTGWKQWVDEDLRPLGLLEANDVAYLASDFRLASQFAWAAGVHDLERVGTVASQFQYRFWPRPHPSKYPRAVFFEDNRRAAGLGWVPFCATPLSWNTKKILLRGELIKEIRWAVCPQFQWDPRKTSDWK